MLHINKTNRFEYKNNPAKILKNTKKYQKVSVVFLDSVSFIPQNLINEAKMKNIPEMFITFSNIKNELIKELETNYTDHIINKAGLLKSGFIFILFAYILLLSASR